MLLNVKVQDKAHSMQLNVKVQDKAHSMQCFCCGPLRDAGKSLIFILRQYRIPQAQPPLLQAC